MKGDRPGGPIHWKMHIKVLPEKVFGALDSDAGRAAYWAEFSRATEGEFELGFINGISTRVKVVERRPPDSLVLEYFGSPARFELHPDGAGGTDLNLTHTQVEEDEWHEVHAGWLNVLFPLKAYLEFNVDLRNHDPQRSWDQGYADQ